MKTGKDIFKTWERILQKRLRNKIELSGKLSELQLGSRQKRDTTQALLATELILQRAREKKTNIYLAHIDLSKAYNRVNRPKLWQTLRDKGIKGKLLDAIISTYSDMTETVRIGKERTDPYYLKNGIRQGSVLSPLLFIIYMTPLIEALKATNTGYDTKAEQTGRIP